MLRYKFSGPNFISPLTQKKKLTQAHKLFWAHINIFHILPKYSPCYWAPTNTLYTSPINYLEPSHKYYPLYPIWVFHKKYLPRCYQNWATKLHHLHKKAQNHLTCGKNPKAQQNSLIMAPQKAIAIRQCFCKILQNPNTNLAPI